MNLWFSLHLFVHPSFLVSLVSTYPLISRLADRSTGKT
jgi:hypothetical protein